MLKYLIIIICAIFLVFGCSKKNKKKIVDINEVESSQVIYKEAIDALKTGDAYYASKKFKEAESLMSDIEWSAKSALMSAFALYSANFYSQSIFNLERYAMEPDLGLGSTDISLQITFCFSQRCFIFVRLRIYISRQVVTRCLI